MICQFKHSTHINRLCGVIGGFKHGDSSLLCSMSEQRGVYLTAMCALFFPFPWTVTLAVFAVIQLGHHISDPQPVRDVLVFFTASWFEACATNVDFRVQPVP